MHSQSVEQLIFEEHKDFTISIVTNEFAVQRGFAFFKGYDNTPCFISTKDDYERLINRIMRNIAQKVPHVATLVKACFADAFTVDNLGEIVDSLFKLFSAHEHQAAGPEVIDPIIIRENLFTNKDIAEIINLHKQSTIRPRIVIILKDNNLDRAKNLLRFCHHGLRVRMIQNSGVSEICKVINTGTDDVEQFLDVYARQCFDACSRTKTNIIFNDEWAGNSSIRRYAPQLLRFRTNVIYDNKSGILGDVESYIRNFVSSGSNSEVELGFRCLAHLFSVYCRDMGGQDILEAQKIANELENDILQAHVFRYAHFLPGMSRTDQNSCLEKAQDIFNSKGMADHGTYCENNRLLNSFYDNHIVRARFDDMLSRARSDVPGLVGMSTIWNNTGVAYLYDGLNAEAIECFTKGLAHYPDKTKQLGLMSNLLIAKARAGESCSEAEIRNAVEHALLYFGPGQYAFLGANNIINALKVSPRDFARELISTHPISQAINDGLTGVLGSSSLNAQVAANASLLSSLGLSIKKARPGSQVAGLRSKFIEVTGFNPAIYNVWF